MNYFGQIVHQMENNYLKANFENSEMKDVLVTFKTFFIFSKNKNSGILYQFLLYSRKTGTLYKRSDKILCSPKTKLLAHFIEKNLFFFIFTKNGNV